MRRPAEEWLLSEETGREFSHCVRCGLPLVETDSPWLVNKEYHRGECVLEYAICGGCRDEVTGSLSEESRESARGFLEAETDWQEWLERAMMMPGVAERFERCIACGAARGEVEGFGISAYFDPGGSLVTGPLPLMICSVCVGRMTALLSEESREAWKEFRERFLSGDSAFPGLF